MVRVLMIIITFAGGSAIAANSAPVIESVSFDPPHPSFSGLCLPSGELTPIVPTVTFSVSATDPDGQPLTVTYDYGDGIIDTLGTHTYTIVGTFLATITVSDGEASVSTYVTVPVATAALAFCPKPITLQSFNAKVYLRKLDKDRVTFTAVLPGIQVLPAVTWFISTELETKSFPFETGSEPVKKIKGSKVRLQSRGSDSLLTAKLKGTFQALRNPALAESEDVNLRINIVASVAYADGTSNYGVFYSNVSARLSSIKARRRRFLMVTSTLP